MALSEEDALFVRGAVARMLSEHGLSSWLEQIDSYINDFDLEMLENSNDYSNAAERSLALLLDQIYEYTAPMKGQSLAKHLSEYLSDGGGLDSIEVVAEDPWTFGERVSINLTKAPDLREITQQVLFVFESLKLKRPRIDFGEPEPPLEPTLR